MWWRSAPALLAKRLPVCIHQASFCSFASSMQHQFCDPTVPVHNNRAADSILVSSFHFKIQCHPASVRKQSTSNSKAIVAQCMQNSYIFHT